MTKTELNQLHLNQRVKLKRIDLLKMKSIELFGYVTKIYKSNWQVQVWFDGQEKPVVVGYTRLEIADS